MRIPAAIFLALVLLGASDGHALVIDAVGAGSVNEHTDITVGMMGPVAQVVRTVSPDLLVFTLAQPGPIGTTPNVTKAIAVFSTAGPDCQYSHSDDAHRCVRRAGASGRHQHRA